jgi:hypothetical protein
MIIQDNGRWRSVYTPEEARTAAEEQIADLTPAERLALQKILGEYDATGDSPTAETVADVEWDEQPVPIREWLMDERLVGETGKDMYPQLREDLIALFTGDYYEAVLCLHPDTRVPLLDGSTPTIAELADRWKHDQTPFSVYSYVDREITTAKAIQPRQTGEDDYYRVTLDDGSSFTGNAHHQMLRRNGEKVMIRNTRPGDSLMPFEVGNHYVIKVEKIGHGPVYCLSVPGAGNFAVSTEEGKGVSTRSGVFSSNTGAIGWG